MLTPQEVAQRYNLAITDFSPGHRYITCPQCSHDRKKKRDPCLGYTITPEGGLSFGCNHCKFHGPNTGDPELSGSPQSRKPNGVFYSYGPDLRHYGKPKPLWKHVNGEGEWENGRGDHDIANLLYRIDEAREAIARGEPVFIVEGEPDVETSRRLGFAAVCNATGAAGWRKSHSAQLRGAHLIVLNDNDEPGYAYAETACKCSLGVAASVRRLDLKTHWQDMPEHGDISDWVKDGGGSAEALRKLIPFAIPYAAPSTPQQSPPQSQTVGAVVIGDFYAYLPEHNYIYRHTGARWPAQSVNGTVPKVGRLKATTWLDRNQSVQQMTWMPGEPTLIKDKLVLQTGWIDHPGATVFNLYRPPILKAGNPARAQRWLDHALKVYPENADYLIRWCAHRVQFPHIKINHGLFLGGAPGVGKDTLLAPVRYAVGEWNCETVSPTTLLGRFNPFLRSVILVISEARDLGDLARPTFYEHTKLIMASPPDALPIDEKNTKPYYVPNVTGVIITSNHKAGGIFLPADDRRHYVAWSPRVFEDFEDGYFNSLWAYFEQGGYDDIASYLLGLDISEFDPKAPPPKTRAFHEIVNASRSAETSEMADALELLGWPEVVTVFDIQTHASNEFADWLKDRKNRRMIPDHFDRCGYTPVVNEGNRRDGLWKIAGRYVAIYAKTALDLADQLNAARKKRDFSI